jgi:DNA repair protein RecN (Recombination protein N)
VPTSDQLLIRRSVSRTGANKVWINDTLATVALLNRTLDPLVEIVGQHEHLTLTRPDAHRSLIDRFGELEPTAAAYAKFHAVWSKARSARRALEEARSARAERIDYVRFQLEELDGLNLREGEYSDLDEKLGKVRNLERLRELSNSALVELQDAERSAGVRIGVALDALAKLADTDAALSDLRVRLADAAAAVEDICADLSRYARLLDENDEDLDSLERRHEELSRAFRKYVSDEAGLIEKQAELRSELGVLTNFEEALESAGTAEREARTRAEASADKLSAKRSVAAKKLFKHVISLLADLGMPHATLELREQRERLTVSGWEGLEMLFSANQGEPVAAIGKIASGGELSRLMLAIKTAASASDRLQTYTFDEVDTGIGGATAEVVGRLLAKLSSGRQLLCVTHHPQIAAFADVHLRAEKTVTDGRTFSRLVTLEESERVEEVGRMLGGAEVTDATLELARAMLSSGAR